MRRTITNLIVILLAAWFYLAGVRPPAENPSEFQINAFAHLPVKFDGRKKPIDTLARNLLTVVSGKQSLRTEDGERMEAVEWLLAILPVAPKPSTTRCSA